MHCINTEWLCLCNAINSLPAECDEYKPSLPPEHPHRTVSILIPGCFYPGLDFFHGTKGNATLALLNDLRFKIFKFITVKYNPSLLPAFVRSQASLFVQPALQCGDRGGGNGITGYDLTT